MLKENIVKLICLSFVILCSAKNESVATQKALAKSNNLITRTKESQLKNLITLGYDNKQWYHGVYDNRLEFEVSLDFPDMQVILQLGGTVDKDFQKKTTSDALNGRLNPFKKRYSWQPKLEAIKSFSLSKHHGNSEGLQMTFQQQIDEKTFYDVTGKFIILNVRYNFKDKENKYINEEVSNFLFGNPKLIDYINLREEKQRKALEEKQALELRRQQGEKRVAHYIDAKQKIQRREELAAHYIDAKKRMQRKAQQNTHDDQGAYNNCEGLTGYALQDCEDGQGGYGNNYNDDQDPEEEYYGYRRK